MKKIFLAAMLFATTTLFFSCENTGSENSEMKTPTQNSAKEKEEMEEGENKSTASQANSDKAKTIENMQAAYKGETNASARYAAFAKKADEEGQKEIAALFRAASMAEGIHADNHKQVITEMGAKPDAVTLDVVVKSTKENLEYAISGEAYEVKDMYPNFIKDADASDSQLAMISLTYAYKTEKKHKVLYEKSLAALNNGNTKTLASVFYVCPTCGNTVENAMPKRCDISMTYGDKFIKVI